MPETWRINGWTLTDRLVRDVEYRSGLSRTPAIAGTNARVPGRTGERWRRKTHAAGRFTLNVWVGDTSDRDAVDHLWDDLVRACCQPNRLAEYVRILRDGRARICYGEVLTAISPVQIGTGAWRAGIEVSVPDGYWQGGVPVTHSGSGTVQLPGLADSTAPLERCLIRVSGGSNVTVTDTTPGGSADSFTYAAAIGGTLVVDCDRWEVSGEGFTPNPEALTYTGARFLTISPGAPGVVPQISTTGGTVAVQGRPAYLC